MDCSTWKVCKVSRAVIGLVLLATTGCATVTGGARDQQVRIRSDPQGAAVLLDGQAVGATPARLVLSRTQTHQVDVELPGYAPYHAVLKPGLNPWLIGNVLVGGVIGVAIDWAAGATHRLYPGDINVHLCPVQPAAGCNQ
jgi:hypothetical protein